MVFSMTQSHTCYSDWYVHSIVHIQEERVMGEKMLCKKYFLKKH